jgi:lipoate-protein ligase B
MDLAIIDLGKVSFKEAFLRQVQTHKQVLEGTSAHTLILCEHPHTITFPRQARIENILDRSIVKDETIDFIVGVNRGGDITYHGPGQLVGYPIFDLRRLDKGLKWFLNRIEGLIIRTLAEFGIEADVKYGFRGVWAGDEKIASVGINVDKWVSLHGFALNVNTDLSFFDKIRPCGLNVKMTSIQQQLGRLVDIEFVKHVLAKEALSKFELNETLELIHT